MLQKIFIKSAVSISLVYLVVSSLWIFYSDKILVSLVQDKGTLTFISIVKGWFFVLVTSAMLYFLIRRAMKEIRQSRDYHLKIFEEFPTLIWRAGLDGKCNYFNKTWLEFTGRSIEEEIGDGWANGVHPEDLDGCLSGYRTAFDSRKPFALEYRLRRHDGVYRWISDYGRPYYDLEDRFAGYIGSCYDVTDRKVAEDALLQSEQKFRELTENTSDWIWEVDQDSRYIYSSPKVTDILGYSPSEVLGKTPFDLMTEEEVLRLKSAFGELLNNPRPFRGLVNENLHKNGSHIVLETSGIPLYDLDGHFSGFRGIDRDITLRQKTQERIKDLYRELASRADALEEAYSELEAFAQTVSHDLRTPLTSISLSSQVVLDLCGGIIANECRDLLHNICDASERMADLISSLLDFSLAARSELTWEEVDLSTMVDEISSELRTAEPGRQVAIRIGKGITALGDPKLLRVVMTNLLSNAWKYTSTIVDASIEIGMTEGDGERTYFVRDNGIGFEMSQAEQLFRAFKRLQSEAQFKGHGIGLATVQRIVQRHGGSIRAEGKTGEGATFYFTLPLSPPPVREGFDPHTTV